MPAGIKGRATAIGGAVAAAGLGATAAFGWFGGSSGTMGDTAMPPSASPSASATPSPGMTDETQEQGAPTSTPTTSPTASSTPTTTTSPTTISGQSKDRDDSNHGKHRGWKHAPAFGAKQDRDDR